MNCSVIMIVKDSFFYLGEVGKGGKEEKSGEMLEEIHVLWQPLQFPKEQNLILALFFLNLNLKGHKGGGGVGVVGGGGGEGGCVSALPLSVPVYPSPGTKNEASGAPHPWTTIILIITVVLNLS